MKQEKYRNELKHYISYSDYLAIKHRLQVVAKPDVNTDATGKYRVRSLYFDNYNDKALREKIDGVNQREKFRIRYYNHDHSFIRLEKKIKNNGLCCKKSAAITKEQCQRLLAGDLDWMREGVHPLITELYLKMTYENLRPKTIVDYIREPFVYQPGNVRITVDSQIRTGIYATDLLNVHLPTLGVNTGGAILLEVKFDEFLPDLIRDIIQIGNRQGTAFSKYASCRLYG